MDTVYIFNKQSITFPETINSHIDNFPDSVHVEGLVSIKEMPCSSQIDSLIRIGNDIVGYGIGYNDSISNIAFPLIIDVFAFALPFLFSAINHVNSKYDSTAISNMFKSSIKYKALWWSIGINVGIMMLYGLFSILPFDTFHHWLGVFFSYLLVILVAWMVISVFLFMQYCITYNKPYDVVEEIKRRYSIEKADAEKKDLKLSKKLRKAKEAQSQSGKMVYEMIGSMYMKAYSNDADLKLINRLSEMCTYAMRKNDYNLYSSVWSQVYEIQKTEKKFDDTSKNDEVVSDDCKKNLTSSILLKTCENIGESAINMQIQGSIIRT